MKFRHIVVDDSLQELTQHGDEAFPVSMDRQQAASKYCALVKHWHYEVQINLVVKGSVGIRTPHGEYMLQQGQGIFISGGCLHEVVPTKDFESEYICVNFHPKMIYGYAGSAIHRDYVEPVAFSDELQAIPLYGEGWQKQVCAIMGRLARVNEEQAYGYEIETKALLCQIWLLLVRQNQPRVENATPTSFSDKQRMRTLQNFIHKHYMDAISLADMAGVAHISRGECCRFFKRVLQTTPVSYLTHHRVQQSIKLLAMTDLNIAQVAQECGFGSGSYYTECFKREMKCTPLDYRRHYSQPGKTQTG